MAVRSTSALLLAGSVVLLGGCADEPHGPPPKEPRRDAAPGTEASVEELRALGYVDVGAPLDDEERTGVLRHDRARTAPGLNLWTSSHECTTRLTDLDGRVLRTWSGDPCFRWGNAALAPTGDLVAVGRRPFDPEDAEAAVASRYLVRQTWGGELVWETVVPVHHDVEWTPDGRVLSMTYAFRDVPALNPEAPLEDNSLALFSAEGELLEEVSLWDLLGGLEGGLVSGKLRPRHRDGLDSIDALHLNCVEWMRQDGLFGAHALYDPRHVLICLRHQDLLVIFRWDTHDIVWSYGPGVLSGPHDATLLANGNVLVFDNGLERGWSRVLEIDPRTDGIVWSHGSDGPDAFYTTTRGANQRLANGNTLITISEEGRAIEVTPAGEVVWEYRNEFLTDDRRPGVIVRMRRLEGLTAEDVRKRLAEGRPLPVVD